MAYIHKLEDLNLMNNQNWVICVKVLSIWDHPPNLNGDVTTMILVDAKHHRIVATIRRLNLREKSRRALQEGLWFNISQFRVIPSTHRVETYVLNRLHIMFRWDTVVFRMSELVKSDFTDYLFPNELEDSATDNVVDVTDAIGVVASVSSIKMFPYVRNKGETDYEARYVSFELMDNWEQKLKCVAVGSMCEEFVTKWSRRITKSTYNYEPVVCVVRFWRIASVDGENVLKSEFGCSRLHIDPSFPYFDLASYLRSFKDADDQEVTMEPLTKG